jgi:tetratricopeptide (TPR) repeat protein
MVKLQVSKPKKLVAVVAILGLILLVGIGAYLIYVKTHSNTKSGSKKLTSSQKSVIAEGASQDRCKTSIEKLDGVDDKALSPRDAANYYNFQGNCYYETSNYNKAIEFYKKARDECKAVNDARCVGVAEMQIKAAENTIKTGDR